MDHAPYGIKKSCFTSKSTNSCSSEAKHDRYGYINKKRHDKIASKLLVMPYLVPMHRIVLSSFYGTLPD